MTTKTNEKTSIVNKLLNGVEKASNKLPDPAMLFFLMCIGLAVITLGSFLCLMYRLSIQEMEIPYI